MKQSRLDEHSLYISFGLRLRKRFPIIKKESRSALFLDIDGTIWPDSGPGSLVAGKFVQPEVQTCIRQLRKRFDFLVLVTNQTYFSRKPSIDGAELRIYFRNARKLAKNLGVDVVLSCHHHPEAQNITLRKLCDFRKPSPGMFKLTIEMLSLDRNRCVVIGDRITDVIASAEAGITDNFLLSNLDAFKMNVSKSPNVDVGVFFRFIESLEDVDSAIGKS